MNANNLGAVYKTVNMLAGNYNNQIQLINQGPNEDSILITWKNYFQKLLNNEHGEENVEDIPEKDTDLDININDFTMEEIKEAISAFKNGKATGIDNIKIETLKYGGDKLIKYILNICNHVYNHKVSPDECGTIML